MALPSVKDLLVSHQIGQGLGRVKCLLLVSVEGEVLDCNDVGLIYI